MRAVLCVCLCLDVVIFTWVSNIHCLFPHHTDSLNVLKKEKLVNFQRVLFTCIENLHKGDGQLHGVVIINMVTS